MSGPRQSAFDLTGRSSKLSTTRLTLPLQDRHSVRHGSPKAHKLVLRLEVQAQWRVVVLRSYAFRRIGFSIVATLFFSLLAVTTRGFAAPDQFGDYATVDSNLDFR